MYKPIHGYTKQKIISIIQTRMLDHPSYDGKRCLYLAQDGNHCPAGCFLTEELLKFYGDNDYPIQTLMVNYPELKAAMPLNPKGMIELQFLHDGVVLNYDDNSDPRPRLIKWVEENVQ